MGDMVRARAEFETVRSQDPPLAARTAIDRDLAGIDQRTRDRRTRVSVCLEAALGGEQEPNVLRYTRPKSPRRRFSITDEAVHPNDNKPTP